MIVALIGSRGTVPTGKTATTTFLVNNRFLFECPSEIIHVFMNFKQQWKQMIETTNNQAIKGEGIPTLGRIEYIILSHLHWDHWGGLRHIIHRIMLFEREKRETKRLKIVIPEKSTWAFQKRFNERFFPTKDPNSYLDDDIFLLNMLEIEIGPDVRKLVEIITLEDNKTLRLDKNIFLYTKQNNHLPEGSFSFIIQEKKLKLNVKKAKDLKIPFNHVLGEIQRKNVSLVINGKKITREDIFEDKTISIGYSGDTPFDKELLTFFTDCQCVIHETTYLRYDEEYHLDTHTNYEELIEQISNLKKIKVLIPIHFSVRFSEEEINLALSKKSSDSFSVINPLESLGFLITAEQFVSFPRKNNKNR